MSHDSLDYSLEIMIVAWRMSVAADIRALVGNPAQSSNSLHRQREKFSSSAAVRPLFSKMRFIDQIRMDITF
jgi:hypothetical protein